jgi:hypothetical protein
MEGASSVGARKMQVKKDGWAKHAIKGIPIVWASTFAVTDESRSYANQPIGEAARTRTQKAIRRSLYRRKNAEDEPEEVNQVGRFGRLWDARGVRPDPSRRVIPYPAVAIDHGLFLTQRCLGLEPLF